MNTFVRGINLLLSIFLFTMIDVSVLYGADENNFHTVPTYECIGLYFKSPDLGQCDVRFTETGTSKHRQGYPLVYDSRNKEYRGSIIANVWDDAIESEGANMNVRIWNNYIEKTFQHIATACTSKGPLYIFRNVFGESRRTHRDPLGGSMIKVGERNEFGGGRKLVFHNTAIQPRGAFHVFSGHVNPNTVTRNNVFDCPGRLTSSRQAETPCDFDYDLFTGMDRGIARERHGIRGNHSFIKSYALIRRYSQ